ncbi:hypothetical protein [Flammeovirga aprica]|uniref:Uncharacterized protein n=1 Tax=Flammeovirga aprica JL-4 TaxID=694437 RepID=A0A7X9RSZ1_9BACT|nr:hypothetical protein [Flammeovirga aprica]NME66587.1 hypothetical protein [Flammeovirga aprica JL-4]
MALYNDQGNYSYSDKMYGSNNIVDSYAILQAIHKLTHQVSQIQKEVTGQKEERKKQELPSSFSVATASEFSGISKDGIRKSAKSGKFNYYQNGSGNNCKMFIEKDSFLEYLKSISTKTDKI